MSSNIFRQFTKTTFLSYNELDDGENCFSLLNTLLLNSKVGTDWEIAYITTLES